MTKESKDAMSLNKEIFCLREQCSRKRHKEGGLAADVGRRVRFVGQEGEAH